MDGDGLELVTLPDSSVYFDLNEDGFAENSGWVGGDDGLLVIDLNGNGRIDGTAELFANTNGFDDGFAQLASYDTNGDGIISAADDQFEDLLIWRDFHPDGISQSDELFSLADVGIESIDLSVTDVDQTNQDHVISQTGSVTFVGGTQTSIEGVLFNTDVGNSAFVLPENFEYTSLTPKPESSDVR